MLTTCIGVRRHTTIGMSPEACLADPSLWAQVTASTMKRAYRYRRAVKALGEGDPRRISVGALVLVNTNRRAGSNMLKTSQPIWNSFGQVIRRRSEYTFEVEIVVAGKHMRSSKFKVGVNPSVNMNVR